jgi:hypothetical protein
MKDLDYFREKIERALSLIEDQASKIDGAYGAEVERLAAKTADPVLADFIRARMKPEGIVSEARNVRDRLDTGEIGAADQALDRLKNSIESWTLECIAATSRLELHHRSVLGRAVSKSGMPMPVATTSCSSIIWIAGLIQGCRILR